LAKSNPGDLLPEGLIAPFSCARSHTSLPKYRLGGYFPKEHSIHIARGDRPGGANICFVDGHQEWRRFSQMEMRVEMPPWHWW